MTAISNLYAKYYYRSGSHNLPLAILMHGWSSDVLTGIGDATAKRIADYGFFVISVGMRGRNGADGFRDASAREVFDIYDAVEYVRSNFSDIVSPDKAAIIGYSGGAGNALAVACKFPDMFSVVVSYFGMSDYGRDITNGWYQNNGGGYTAQIEAAVGDTPVNSPDRYYARDATEAISNFIGGNLFLFHDQGDTTVPPIHSLRVKTALDNAEMINYSYNLSSVGDSMRWIHGNPGELGYEMVASEAMWFTDALNLSSWTIPASGSVTVIGYIVTKRFTIWLNSGLDAAATVVYDTAAGTYTITPLTSNPVVAVTITQGALTASGNTNGETLFTVI